MGAEFADFFGVGGGQVVFFAEVMGEVVEFDLAGAFFPAGADVQFPIAGADGGDAGLRAAEQERLVRRFGALRERGPEIAAIEGERLRRGSAGEFQQGGEPIDEVERFVDYAAGGDATGPAGAGADADATLVERALAGAEGAVGGDFAGLGAAVVTGENHEGVFAEAGLVQGCEDLADALGLKVQLVDRGGKGELTVRYGSLEQLDDLCRRLMRG